MISCPNCAKENQNHYKFCLACGSRLATDGLALTKATKPPNAPAQIAGTRIMPQVADPGPQEHPPAPTDRASLFPARPPTVKPRPASLATKAAPGEPPAEPGEVASQRGPNLCSKCRFSNPSVFKFCGRCGTGLRDPEPPPAPKPAGGAKADPIDKTRPSKNGPAHQPAARLIMLGLEGQALGERVVAEGETLEVGRGFGSPWDDDAYLDLDHARLSPVGGGVRIEDRGSLNGIFVKLTKRTDIQDTDQFRVGQELLRYEDLPEPAAAADGTEQMGSPNPGYWGRLRIMVEPDRASEAYPIDGDGISIGREFGDITFPRDGYVSGQHCRIVGDDDGVYIEDMGSSNGTYLRVRDGQTVPYGSLILIGQKLFQIEAPTASSPARPPQT